MARPGHGPLDRLALPARGEHGLAAETLPARLRSLPSLAGAGADRIALELGQPAGQAQHQTPYAVVVSVHASPSERKPAFFPAIAESQLQTLQGAVFLYLPSMLFSGFMFSFQG